MVIIDYYQTLQHKEDAELERHPAPKECLQSVRLGRRLRSKAVAVETVRQRVVDQRKRMELTCVGRECIYSEERCDKRNLQMHSSDLI